ncbi:B12-binding domain-containing radical SAM protein [Thermodesulfobacteriota bacterium]
MHITLINPNLSGDVSILDIGLGYLSTFLNERTGHRAEIVDLTYHRRDWRRRLGEELDRHRPDAIGITCNSLYMHYIRDIIRRIKDEDDIPIVLGGYHVSLLPEESIAEEGVDAICIGDGEKPLTAYLDRLEAGREPSDIQGLWYRKDGQVRKSELCELTQDIDSLPVPDYDLWKDIDKFLFFNGMIYFIANRGCLYNCSYCSMAPMKESIPGEHFRKRDPAMFAEEILHQWRKYRGRGMRIAHMFDSVFTVDPDWLHAFCTSYRELGLADDLPFSIFSRADTLDEPTIAMLAAANCRIVRIGIEAGDERIRNEVYQKNITNDTFRDVFRLLHRHGIHATGYNILGGPGETAETLRATYRFAKELEVDRPIFFTYRPLPKTKGIEHVYAYGGKIDFEKMETIDSLHGGANVYTGSLTPRQIIWFRRKCLLVFSTIRILKLIRMQKARFFINFIKFLIVGLRHGVSPQYIAGYFLVSAGDNLFN